MLFAHCRFVLTEINFLTGSYNFTDSSLFSRPSEFLLGNENIIRRCGDIPVRLNFHKIVIIPLTSVRYSGIASILPLSPTAVPRLNCTLKNVVFKSLVGEASRDKLRCSLLGGNVISRARVQYERKNVRVLMTTKYDVVSPCAHQI